MALRQSPSIEARSSQRLGSSSAIGLALFLIGKTHGVFPIVAKFGKAKLLLSRELGTRIELAAQQELRPPLFGLSTIAD